MNAHLESQQANVLSGLREAHASLRSNQTRVESLVAAAREYGISWQSIGTVLGISKQAAWERFGKTDLRPGHNRPPEEDN